MVKKVISTVLAVMMIVSVSIPGIGAAEQTTIVMRIDDPNMTVNGVTMEIDPGRGTVPMIIANRTVIPIRALVEALGGTVGWDDADQRITLTANDRVVEMWVDDNTIVVNEIGGIIEVAPVVINGRTMVPVRFAAESLGFYVGWVEETSEIIVSTEPVDSGATAVATKPVGTTSSISDKSDVAQVLAFFKALATDQPTGGKSISIAEMDAMREQYYGIALTGSGNATYDYGIHGYFEKTGGKWEPLYTVMARESWYQMDSDDFVYYSENLIVFADGYSIDKPGDIQCSLSKSDDVYYFDYLWMKGANEGHYMKWPKSGDSDGSYGTYVDMRGDAYIYEDQIIDGQLCKVFSFIYTDIPNGDREYFWLSTVTGVVVKSAIYENDTGNLSLVYSTLNEYVNKDASIFKVPDGVNFVEMDMYYGD